MRRIHKKGAMELSINAIVIIILAMTLLGLGLGFVRGLFTKITETTGSVTEQMREQILEDLRTGDKKISFPSTNVNMPRKGEQVLAVGIKNTDPSPLKFKIKVCEIVGNTAVTDPECHVWLVSDKKLEPSTYALAVYGNSDLASVEPGTTVSGSDKNPWPTNADKKDSDQSYYSLLWDDSDQTLAPGESKVWGITAKSASSATGTIMLKVRVMAESSTLAADCITSGAGGYCDEYVSKTFFMKFV